MKNKITITGLTLILFVAGLSGCIEDNNSNTNSDDEDIIAVPEDDRSTIYKQIGDEINITLHRSILCKWELDDFDNSVLSLKDDYNWSKYSYEPGVKTPVGDAGYRTWIFEVIGGGKTTLNFTSYHIANEPHSIYGTYVLYIVVE